MEMTLLKLIEINNVLYIYGEFSKGQQGVFFSQKRYACLGLINPYTNFPVWSESYSPWMAEHNLSPEDALKDDIQKNKNYDFIRLNDIEEPSSSESSKTPNLSRLELIEPKSSPITFNADEINKIDVKLTGTDYLLRHIADSIGLTEILQDSFPAKWKKILSTAITRSILNDVSSNHPYRMDFFEELQDTEETRLAKMKEDLSELTLDEKLNFYRKWLHHAQNLDLGYQDEPTIFTISSEKQYQHLNRYLLRKKRKEIVFDVCLPFAEKSALPLCLINFNGPVNELTSIIQRTGLYDPESENKVKFVLESNIFFNKNINFLFKNSAKFLIEMPNNLKLRDDFIDKFQEMCMNQQYFTRLLTCNIFGISLPKSWKRLEVWWNILVDVDNLKETHNEVRKKIILTQRELDENRYDLFLEPSIYRFFIKRKIRNTRNEYVIRPNKNSIKNFLIKECWFVYLSHNFITTKESVSAHTDSQIVKKSFEILSPINDEQDIIDPTRIHHSNEGLIGFLSLILTSRVRKIMSDNNLNEEYTVRELYFILNSIKKISINNSVFYSPLTIKQKDILAKFKCPYPQNVL
jgi:hypothetical protein